MEKLVWSKQIWLETFGSGKGARPRHEIETKERELAVLEQARDDYRGDAEKAAA